MIQHSSHSLYSYQLARRDLFWIPSCASQHKSAKSISATVLLSTEPLQTTILVWLWVMTHCISTTGLLMSAHFSITLALPCCCRNKKRQGGHRHVDCGLHIYICSSLEVTVRILTFELKYTAIPHHEWVWHQGQLDTPSKFQGDAVSTKKRWIQWSFMDLHDISWSAPHDDMPVFGKLVSLALLKKLYQNKHILLPELNHLWCCLSLSKSLSDKLSDT